MEKFLKGKEAYAAEFLGTYLMVLCGCGAVAGGSRFPGLGVAMGAPLVFGLVVMALVYSLAPVSGAHFNPAVSLGFHLRGKLSLEALKIYAACQAAGATLAAITVKSLVPSGTIGTTSAALPWYQAWPLEVLITFILVFVIMSVTDERKNLGSAAVGLAIGATITLNSIWCGPLTDASMNPARSLGPALAAFDFKQLWIYLSAPFAGAWLAAQVFVLIRPDSK